MALKIGILGCGNMGTAIVQGLKRSDKISEIRVKDRNPQKIEHVQALPGDVPVQDACEDPTWLTDLDALLILVKPKDVEHTLLSVKDVLDPKTLVVSCAAGLPLSRLRGAVKPEQNLARAMPNTAARFGKSLTTIVCEKTSLSMVLDAVFNPIGEVLALGNEAEMHAATALAGSGPAFFLYLTEAMARAGVDLGLDPSVARKLAHGGLLGAAVLAEDTTLSLATMREQITSPNGTTEAGLMEMKAKKLDSAIEETVKVTSARSQAMAREKKS